MVFSYLAHTEFTFAILYILVKKIGYMYMLGTLQVAYK